MADKTQLKGQDIKIAVFDKDRKYLYAYKKAERLASALYIVSNLVPEDEPIRMQLRERSVSLLHSIVSFSVLSNTKIQVATALAHVIEICGLLDIARTLGLVSEMNHRVLVNEYIDFGHFIQTHADQLGENLGAIPFRLFDTRTLEDELDQYLSQTDSVTDTNKRQKQPQNVSDVSRANTPKAQPIKKTTTVDDTGHQKDKKRERRDVIFSVLKERNSVTVKDIARVVHDCSEKTLQRELGALVASGVLKKEGERRWSTYSLVS